MEKKCELCENQAAVFCAADDANVCWNCDAKVHSANFLVARHARSVLCSMCSLLTDCMVSGSRVLPLSRLCSLCSPAPVERPDLDDCNGDSEEKENSEALSHPSAATEVEVSGCTCASQESHTSGHRSSQGRRRQAAGKYSRGVNTAKSKRHGINDRGKKLDHARRGIEVFLLLASFPFVPER